MRQFEALLLLTLCLSAAKAQDGNVTAIDGKAGSGKGMVF
jgi:hypothetical protein